MNDGEAVEKLRAVKDADELSRIREAAELISEVFGEVLRRINPESRNSNWPPRSNMRSSAEEAPGRHLRPSWRPGRVRPGRMPRPTSKPLRKSELVVLDQGAILRGYCSDMTRTVFLGRRPRRCRSLYRAVLEAQEAAKRAIRPGVTAGDVDRAARDVLKRAKLDRYFTHSTGHGLGLEVHEMPRLGKGEKTVLQEGMVLTVEPGVYWKGLAGIRIEDDVVVTASGSVDLTTAPREFLEL